MDSVTDQLTSLGIAFGLVLLVELPDKTLIATLLLATRYRPRPVLVGVAAAFALQCAIAVTAGGLLRLLPAAMVDAVVAVLFGAGAFVLIRESLREPDHLELEAASARQQLPATRIALTSFGVLFAAEWGDASQIATAGIAARRGSPLWTALGAWLALVAVAVVATHVGRAIVARIHVRTVHRVAGVLFAVFAALAVVAAIQAD